MSFRDNLNKKIEESKLGKKIGSEFSDIFFGAGNNKLILEKPTQADIENYKQAIKILRAADKDCKISLMLDLNGEDFDRLVISDYDDEYLLKLGVIVGTLQKD